jgi:hypothetical protein
MCGCVHGGEGFVGFCGPRLLGGSVAFGGSRAGDLSVGSVDGLLVVDLHVAAAGLVLSRARRGRDLGLGLGGKVQLLSG